MLFCVYHNIIDLLFPRRCPICHRIVTPKKALVCHTCIGKIHLIRQPTCKSCGKEVYSETMEYCFDCQKHHHTYEYGISLTRYDDLIKQSMIAIKYKNKREYLDFYVQAIYKYCASRIERMAVDLLVPIPIHPKRLRQRGFNQAQILAEGIGGRLQIPVISDGLIRNKNTDPQKQLSGRERFENLHKAFSVKKNYFYGKSILLVDDIYTTGSTIEACTRVLKKHGADKIYFITICIGSDGC